MPSDAPDERSASAAGRAIRAELRRLGERLFWTFLAAFGLFWGLFLVVSGNNGRGGAAVAFVLLGVALVAAAVRALLLKWELPPYR